MKKERVDVLLVQNGLFDSREKAQRAIMAGLVFDKNVRVDKPGVKIDAETHLEVKGNPIPYVGRGGLKLEKALKIFDIELQSKIMLDIGASTGGFTDCALQNGARMVYALDVGYNQLAWKLRQDARVIVMERTNFRYCQPSDFQDGLPDIATIDVSFISLTKILPVLKALLLPGGDVMTLIKPQFEAGKDQVGKKGIVRDGKIHLHVIQTILDFSVNLGYDTLDLSFSPITGGDGNIEFLLHLKWHGPDHLGENLIQKTPLAVVEEAHHELKKKRT